MSYTLFLIEIDFSVPVSVGSRWTSIYRINCFSAVYYISRSDSAVTRASCSYDVARFLPSSLFSFNLYQPQKSVFVLIQCYFILINFFNGTERCK